MPGAMVAQALFVVGAAVLGLLGALHLAFTFFTPNFEARNPATSAAMRADHPRLTRRTSLWDAWVGFNASHSLGALLFAGVYLLLALGHMAVLRESMALAWLAPAGGAAYLAIAVRYWFRTPLIGIAVATACFTGAALMLQL